MKSQDIRWIQRYSHFQTALAQLTEAVEISKSRALSKLEKQGLIQAFEFTHELAWNLMKDYIEHTGGQKLIGSKDTTREAFQKNIIPDGDTWMSMIASRNLTSHTYNQDTANAIHDKILTHYYEAFTWLDSAMKKLAK